MLKIESVQSFSFKMSVKNLGFSLPVKIEEDLKLFIDLDTEGNSPEDIVIEWHLEIRRFFGSYSAASGEINVISIMKEYIAALTERAIHFEDVVRLQDMVDNHIEYIYWFYKESENCFSDIYLDHMEHILTFYVNLTLRVLLVLKKKVKVTQKKVNDMAQKVINRLSVYLLKSEYHIFHVLIRQTTTLMDGMIKDVMNILNSNICKQMFRNLYMYFLVLTPVRDMSDEAFCRSYILFENWKAFEDYKQNEKIEECVKNIFNRDMNSIKENEFLRNILMPQTSIMSELMKVMGCNPSITKAYFDYIKSKQKVDTEIIDDIGKLALEDSLILETELTDEDDYEITYLEIFNKIMGGTKYNLNEIVLNIGDSKNEEVTSLSEKKTVTEEVEILISDTDSDSDVEIVSIVPSLNSTRQVTNTTRRRRNTVANTQTTSFLESISIEVDTSRRKYGFRTLGNFDKLPSKKTMDTHQTTIATDENAESSIVEDQDSVSVNIVKKPTEPCLIIDDDSPAVDNEDKGPSIDEDCTSETVSNIIEPSSSEKNMSTTDNITPTPSDSNSLITNVSNNLSQNPIEPEILVSSFISQKSAVTVPSKIVAVSSTPNIIEEDSTSQAVESVPVMKVLPALKTSVVQTNGIVNQVCRCSHLTTPVLQEEEHVKSSDVFPTISSTMEHVELETQKDKEVETNCSGTEVNLRHNEEASSTGNITTNFQLTMENVESLVQENASLKENAENGTGTEFNLTQNFKEATCNTANIRMNFESKMENVKEFAQQNVSLEKITENSTGNKLILGQTVEEAKSTSDIRSNFEQMSIDNYNHVETDDNMDTCSKKMNVQSTPDETSNNKNSNELELPYAIENTEDNSTPSPIIEEIETQQLENAEDISIEIHLSALLITSESNGYLKPSIQLNENLVNGTPIKDFEECHMHDRTLMCDKNPEVLKCRTEPQLDEPTRCNSDCGKDETNITHSGNNGISDISSTIHKRTTRPSEGITSLDTGQDLFVQSLDTGQFDADSPASPENVEVNVKSPCEKIEMKLLQTVSEPLLRKGQHGEFGYPTPPGSEEERDKDSDDQTKLIYSNILPTQTFCMNENIDLQDSENDQVTQMPYETLTSKNITSQEFLSVAVKANIMTTSNTQVIERMSDEPNGEKEDASQSLGKFYEQIVKDAIGSQNSTEDEEETQVSSRKYIKDKDQDISFYEMEQFLKNCDNEDYSQANRKKRKRPREKVIIEDRSRKNPIVRSSPKRVKINEKPETHFITTSYDEDSKDDIWEKQDSNEYDFFSSDNEMDSSRHRVKAKRKPLPMPQSKYLSKRNGAVTHVPLSGRLSPDIPPPLKGILKRIEQKHTYHPLHPVDDEPETVVIVLHQRELGSGKRGSVEVKVYRQSFSAYQIPFDDHKLCHHAFVKLDDNISSKNLGSRGKVSGRARNFEEEILKQPETTMYKIVFDKKTPQLNPNDRKYYFDPSISSNSSANSSKCTLFENEQGTVNLSTEIAFIKTPEPVESIVGPAIQTPISPPCFSPSSNSSSEFSDPTNLIPYQDIERALQFVDPEKPDEDASGYSLDCHDSNDSLEKSLVDRIALETIELLSNNADFHKMLRDLNGEVLIENVPLIGMDQTRNIGDISVVPDMPSINDDLVSNLNSDEQMLKKVCQELESKALVDNLTYDQTNPVIASESFLEVNAQENISEEMVDIEIDGTDVEPDQICYEKEINTHVSSLSRVPNNGFSLDVSISSIENSSTPVSPLSVLPVNVRYSPPIISHIPNSLHQETFSVVHDLTSTHSGHSNLPLLNSPTFTPKDSPVKMSPILSFHQEKYSSSAHVSTMKSTNSEMNFSSNSTTLSRTSPVLNIHQQIFSSIPKLPLTHSAPLVSPIPKSFHQETYSSIPDSSALHSSYSQMDVRVLSPLPVHSASNSPHQTPGSNMEIEPFLPNPAIAAPVYPEDLLRCASSTSTLLSYPQSNSIVCTASLFASNVSTNSYVHNLPSTLPTYTETNCLIPNVPVVHSHTEEKCIVPSSTAIVPPLPETNGSIFNTTPMNTYFEPSTSHPNTTEACVYSPNSELHSHGSIKTDTWRKRLPKEVLTISQLNKSEFSNKDCIDNNLKQNSSIYSPKSKKFVYLKGNSARQVCKADHRNVLTDELFKNSRSSDPRLGQPLICVPPFFIQDLYRPSLIVNLPLSPETLKELKKKSLSRRNKRPFQKLPIINPINNKSITKLDINSLRSCQTLRKFTDKTPSLGIPNNVTDSTGSLNTFKNTVDIESFSEVNDNVTNSAKSLGTPKNVLDASIFSGVSKNLPNSSMSFNVYKNVHGVTSFLGATNDYPDPVSFSEVPINIKYSTTSVVPPNNNVDATKMVDDIDNVGTSLGVLKNDTSKSTFSEKPTKIIDSAATLIASKHDLETADFFPISKNIPNTMASSTIEVPKSKTQQNTPKNDSIARQSIPTDRGSKRTKSKATGRKRGRPPKNTKSSTKNGSKDVQHNIPPVSKNIPPNSIHVITNNYNERVPPIYQPEVLQRKYPATRNATQPRVEPLKIVKDPKSKNGYIKVSSVHTKTTLLPMPVPKTYNFESDTLKKEVYNMKLSDNGENDVEFETHLPLKKRKLSMPVPTIDQGQPATLTNVPRSRNKNDEISYPATPMLSIADVYMQPRTFKTPAEKKQLPPKISNTVPICYKPPSVPDSQFNCSLNTYTPSMYGFSKCPYSVELDCNSYCPPPVLFPPEPFTHTN